MHNLLQRYGKLFSVGLSVVCSVLLVAVVVSAATTIGANISTGGALEVTGATTLTGAATLSDTLAVTGLSTLGKASSSLVSSYGDLYVGSTATTTISGSATSTFAKSVILDESGANTSTLQIGHTSASKGQGGCIALAADDGTALYLIVTNVGNHYELATSTLARDCGY